MFSSLHRSNRGPTLNYKKASISMELASFVDLKLHGYLTKRSVEKLGVRKYKKVNLPVLDTGMANG